MCLRSHPRIILEYPYINFFLSLFSICPFPCFLFAHLSWKFHFLHISKKIKRCIGVLSKIRYSVTDLVLVQLYYSLTYPFLTYSLITWGTTYQTTLLPLITFQKRAVRMITFSEYNCHSNPLFQKFSGVKVWNSIEDSLKSKSRTCFKILLKESLISYY